MNSIKYRYSLDENNELIDIENVDRDTKKNQHYHCIECGEEMIPAIGIKNRKHFRHKVCLNCNGESYLHKLAKRMIRDKFLSSDDFGLTYYSRETCLEYKTCRGKNNERCHHNKHTTFNNLRQDYNQCEEEITIDTFRTDLLLTNKDKPDREPILIEIYKTHKSTNQKLNSNHKIIETFPIKTEDDIIGIIENGFVEGINCTVHNFRQSKLSKEPFCHLYEDKENKMFGKPEDDRHREGYWKERWAKQKDAKQAEQENKDTVKTDSYLPYGKWKWTGNKWLPSGLIDKVDNN